ncbi:hypothetical protein SGFS_072250 [Streptomyces graminofaciens]|uniref:Lipoprotein n=1 Tax=Streptomyces graminofaciens TaxID=68212 RepID=A0ABM7FFV4_9ACTN|nr:hypothetical protein [Streptomyces graminofaciens]BBC35931.1 hypothetical protein SGFS_072250 [Streptomyces graminofaciens]
MMKRTLAALAVAVAVTGGAIAFAAPDDGPDGDRTGAAFTHIQFDETTLVDTEESGSADRHVDIFAEHRSDAVSRARFVTTSEGRVLEERLWDSDHPESMTVRNWDTCQAVDEATPDPRPDSLDLIVTQYFGPRAVPDDAEKLAHGVARWEIPAGMMTTEYTDKGGTYPDRVVEIKGPNGEVGSTIRDTSVRDTSALPGWRKGWESCRPVDGSS